MRTKAPKTSIHRSSTKLLMTDNAIQVSNLLRADRSLEGAGAVGQERAICQFAGCASRITHKANSSRAMALGIRSAQGVELIED